VNCKKNSHECCFFSKENKIYFLFRTAHERSHKALDKKSKEKFRWPWEKIANKSLNMDTDDDDAVVFGNDEQDLTDAFVSTADT
jgi:hypothetical protein